MSGILFRRRISVFQDNGQALAAFTHAVSGGAEIKELHLAVVCQRDIVRRDIPVDDPLRMHGFKSLHDRQKYPLCLLPGYAPSPLSDIAFQALALYILHCEIRCPVFLEKAAHFYNIGVSRKSGQRCRFFQKDSLAKGKAVTVCYIIGLYRPGACARGHGAGEILFYCDQFFCIVVLRNVGDAESSLPEHTSGDVFTVQDRPVRKRLRIFALCFAVQGESAVCAIIGGIHHLMKAVVTGFHSLFSSLFSQDPAPDPAPGLLFCVTLVVMTSRP